MSAQLPKMGSRPAKTREDRLKTLEAVDQWTTQPVQEALEKIAPAAAEPQGGGQGAPQAKPKKTRGAVAVKPAPAKAAARPAKPKAEQRVARPWEVVQDDSSAPSSVRPVNFKLPRELDLKLHWLAETTYGYNKTRIVIEALEEKIATMLKERGVE